MAEFKALNAWCPFTPEREANQLGMIASMLSHKVFKKGMNPDEMFPFLKQGVPEFLEDERVKKAKSLKSVILRSPKEVSEAQLKTLYEKVQEEIDLELNSDEPDVYVIRELSNLMKKGKEDAD